MPGDNGNGKHANGDGGPSPDRWPFPFVVGCRRSGTTLLRAMLDSHSDVAVPPESRFLVALAPDGIRAFDGARLLDALYNHDWFSKWQLRRPVVEAAFRDHPPTSYTDAVRRIYGVWGEARGKTRYADKTPDHMLRIGAVATLFPDARFVHLVRDGRDVAASFLELRWADSMERAALHWRHRVLRARAVGATLPSSRYLELRYEDLVERPEPTLRGLCAFLDLTYDPAMLRHERNAAAILRSEAFPHHNRYVARPLRPGLRDWRRDMPAPAVERFEALAADALVAYGYELRSRSHKPSRAIRLATRTDWLAWHTKRLTRSGRASLKGEL